jgi:serine/threonine protein kinase
MIGKIISHYKIIEELGRGGMGVVYKAEDTKLKRTVALKFLPPELTRDHEAKKRFVREAQAASALDHPNICTIHEINETADRQLFIVMACYEGQTLKQKIGNGPISVDEALDISFKIAQGLARAHEEGIVHRDIKPANIILTDRGEVKILDFGLAKLAGQVQLTKDASTLGTVAYMSPEQLSGKEVDQRTDIWSLGVVLYEMIAGNLPFKGSYEQAIIYDILHEELKPLQTVAPNVHPELGAIVNDLLVKEAEKRIQSIPDFLSNIKIYIGSKIDVHSDVKAILSDQKPVRKSSYNRMFVPAVAGLCAILVLIIVYFRLFNKENIEKLSDKNNSIAVLPFTTITQNEEDQIFTDGIHDDIITQLAKIGDLRVIARTSVMQYRAADKRISQIGKELNVQSVLEGSVRRIGDRIRIVAQLIDVESEDHLWAETYDRDYSDVFYIQSDVATKIAEALKTSLTSQERQSIEKIPTDNLEAYEYYLKGNYYYNNYYSKDKYIKATQMFEMATELDPDFVLAYVKLVKVNTMLYNFKTWDHTPERLEKCKTALHDAVKRAPDLAEVRTAKGYYLEWIEKDYKNALNEYEIALKESPNNSTLLSNMGTLFLRQGQAQMATQYFINSYDLDPKSGSQAHLVAWSYTLQRKWNEAEQWYDIYISQYPEKALGYYKKIELCIYGYGDLEKAYSVMRDGQANVRKFDKTYYPWMIDLYSRNYEKALSILEADSTRPDMYSVMKGQLFELLNLHEQARMSYEYAKSLLKDRIIKSPENAFYHVGLGLAYAGLGQKAEALHYGKKATDLHPVQSDPWSSGEEILLKMAEINIMVGEYEKAIGQLEFLLSIPSQVTKWRLKLDPIYDPLRSLPGFQKLILED